MNKNLHIICLDIPFPADYGGAIDMFYKIRQLHEAGVIITLHCFQYGDRKPSAELEKYCRVVYYYPRKTGFRGLHASLPYIISSRQHPDLLQNLLQDKAPVLFEGLHTTLLLKDAALSERIKILRAHNIESDYYLQLAKNCNRLFKKLYYYFESGRLRSYENNLQNLQHILTISMGDTLYFKKKYPEIPVHFVSAFHGHENVTSKEGNGSYCLYHGNLSVAENIRSAQFVAGVFSSLHIPLIIAGKDPGPEIFRLVRNNISVEANPGQQRMDQLIEDAHIHVLPSFQETGMKLKLLHALFAGRFCITNETWLAYGQELSSVLIARDETEFISAIKELMTREFTTAMVEERKYLFNEVSSEGINTILEIIN